MGGRFGKTKAQVGLALLLTVFFTATAGAADLYVQAARAELRSGPSLAAEKLATLPRGERLTRLEEARGWYRVDHGQRAGWVPRLMVGPTPPRGTVSVLNDADEDLGTNARRRASQFTTAAAARGLAARVRASDSSRPDYQSLKQVESLAIEEGEALRFLAERGQ